ncbi:hypothetical protein WCLP8_4140002 [uncultured Gammaproteobacteria bacterium]
MVVDICVIGKHCKFTPQSYSFHSETSHYFLIYIAGEQNVSQRNLDFASMGQVHRLTGNTV